MVRNGNIEFGSINEKDSKGSFRHASKSQLGSKTNTKIELSHISIISPISEN